MEAFQANAHKRTALGVTHGPGAARPSGIFKACTMMMFLLFRSRHHALFTWCGLKAGIFGGDPFAANVKHASALSYAGVAFVKWK